MVEGQKTNTNNDQLLISVKEPYKNLVEINGFTYSVKGETDEVYYQKEFRYSTDGVLYNDWRPLDNDNLRNVLVDPDKEFWPQYKFTQVGYGDLEFESITLDTTTAEGRITQIPMCGVNDNNNCCGQQNLIFECCGNGFNPYALGNSPIIYTQMSKVVSDMFGFCVQYFKTSADQRSKDVILHEYSLLNVIGQGNVKIVIPDNQLPTREINFNPLMMDYPVTFEVHIVKSAFRQVFGQDAKPEVGDYLYFEQYMNKMYEVNATSETDDYLYTGAYWRINLVPYQKRSSVKFENKEDEIDVDTLIFNNDKFNIETLEQEQDARKPDQYNTIGKLENDYVRRILDKKLYISTENIYNSWTVISKSQYALKSVPTGQRVVIYRYDKGWNSNDERMITCWIRPKYQRMMNAKMAVAELLDANGYLAIRTVCNVRNCYDNIKCLGHIKVGDIVKLQGTDYPKSVKITDIEDDILYTNVRFRNNCMNNATITPTTTNEFFNSEGGFHLAHTCNSVCVSVNNKDIVFDIEQTGSDPVFASDKWYGLIVMLKPSESKCGLWVYTLDEGNNRIMNMDSELKLMHYALKENCGNIECHDGQWWLESCEMDITNIRIWNTLCEESLHNLILSQYVVKDSHLCELVDNAQPELLVDKVTNPR